MKNFCFTVDDNIRFFKELVEGSFESIFEHPYLALYKRLHEKFGLKVQLNLFYECEGFDLSRMTDRFFSEWEANSDWLKLSFHSRLENVKPYISSGYEEVFEDCRKVHREILRFASPSALARTTTVHYCLATAEGLRALSDNSIEGLLGLYGDEGSPRSSYLNTPEQCERIRKGEAVPHGGIAYGCIDVVLNRFSTEENLRKLNGLSHKNTIRVMIHEQYFYPDYRHYQSDFEEKLTAVFAYLTENGYVSEFFENELTG